VADSRRSRWNCAVREGLTAAARVAGISGLVVGMFAGAPTWTAAAAPAAPTQSTDSMILSLEDVGAIVGVSDLAPQPLLDLHQPRGMHQYDGQYPSQCQPVFDQDVAFGSDYSQFRSVSYSGAANRAVTQAVGIYASADAARAALIRLANSIQACSELHVPKMEPTVQQLDRSTLAVCFTQCATLYRAKGPVLIGVDAVHFGDSDRIATVVMKQITDRISAA
jgi:hypothetical protein